MKRLTLALLAATFSLSVMAESVNLNSSKSNVSERGKPSKEQMAREAALQGPDTCNFAIDEKGNKFTIDQAGVKRQATEQQQKKCADAKPKSGEAGIAVSDPGVPSNKNTPKK